MNQPISSRASAAASGGAKPLLAGLRVLVVEDEALIAMEIAAILEDEGAEVVGPCDNIESALALISGAPLGAAILDMRVGRDSIERVATALAETETPYLFYSGQPLSAELQAISPQAPMIGKPALGRTLVLALAELKRIKRPRSRA